jgi:hypothetical protein
MPITGNDQADHHPDHQQDFEPAVNKRDIIQCRSVFKDKTALFFIFLYYAKAFPDTTITCGGTVFFLFHMQHGPAFPPAHPTMKLNTGP